VENVRAFGVRLRRIAVLFGRGTAIRGEVPSIRAPTLCLMQYSFDRRHGFGVGRFEIAIMAFSAADGHHAPEAVQLTPLSPGFQAVVGGAQLPQAQLQLL
jgi:hypothetical protein